VVCVPKYNIFNIMNVSKSTSEFEKSATLFALLRQPARIQILFILGAQEACVCHMEAVTGLRQASISQHLMILRKAGLVTAQRDGRNIFYHLSQPELVPVLQKIVLLSGCDPEAMRALTIRPVPGCPCPQCNPGIDPQLACSNQKLQKSI
jgi:DNA-binding transcriptional ArsR family regulator